MSETAHPSSDTPIYKVGIVLLRHSVSGEMEIFIIRPHPKTPGEIPRFVLPRGSRQYRDAEGSWQDARDAQTAHQHAATFEPLHHTILRETEEEAGIPTPELQRLMTAGLILELGARLFASISKPPYLIYWFTGIPDAAAIAAMHQPIDSIETRWATLPEIRTLIAQDAFSSGYLSVIEEALKN